MVYQISTGRCRYRFLRGRNTFPILLYLSPTQHCVPCTILNSTVSRQFHRKYLPEENNTYTEIPNGAKSKYRYAGILHITRVCIAEDREILESYQNTNRGTLAIPKYLPGVPIPDSTLGGTTSVPFHLSR